MPFEIGTFSVTLFALPQDLPEDYIDLLNANRAGCIDLVKDEPEIGWADVYKRQDQNRPRPPRKSTGSKPQEASSVLTTP